VKLSILASGSGGNALYVEADGTRVLLDAGLSPRALRKRLESVPGAPTPEKLDGMLLTHEHADHAGGAKALASRGLRAFATLGTLRELQIDPESHTVITAGQAFRVGALECMPVPVPHDAKDPVGFVLSHDGARMGLLTDCGHPSAAVAKAYAGCDVLIMEANHDPEMLRYGNYPMSLKRRIGGKKGHLSNEEAAELLRMILAGARKLPRCIVLAHLSQMNNRALLARASIARVIGRRPVRVIVASQTRVLPPITCVSSGVEVEAGVPGEQLSLEFALARDCAS
jgi:phosphoribosyl 1,2-cyclic phosphodiesterase